MITERPYQSNAGARCEELWASGVRSVLCVSPVASGKTLIGTQRIRDRRVLWIAPTREIVTNTRDRMCEFVPESNVGLMLGGAPKRRLARVQVASVQSVLERGIQWEWDLTVLDEARHYLASEWREVTRLNPNPRAVTLGLDATPRRADGTELGDIFDAMIAAAQYSDLIRDGYIVGTRVLRPDSFLDGDLALPPFEAYLRYGEGRPSILFEASVAAAKQTVAELKRYRVAAAIVHYGMTHAERERVIQSFRAGDIRVLSNVFAVSEGFDAPIASCAVLARAFATPESMIQACGRIMRRFEGKTDGLVLDLVGCTWHNGMPDEDRVWELAKTPKRETGQSRGPTERSDPERSVLQMELRSVDGKPVPPMPLPEPETRLETISRIAREREAAAAVARSRRPLEQVRARQAARERFERGSQIPDDSAIDELPLESMDFSSTSRLQDLL